jgi:hypothetical protein
MVLTGDTLRISPSALGPNKEDRANLCTRRFCHCVAFSDPSALQVTKGKQRIDFTIPEYEQWLEDTPDAHKWDSKYYKVRDSHTILCLFVFAR